jgi:hypothetical protein
MGVVYYNRSQVLGIPDKEDLRLLWKEASWKAAPGSREGLHGWWEDKSLYSSRGAPSTVKSRKLAGTCAWKGRQTWTLQACSDPQMGQHLKGHIQDACGAIILTSAQRTRIRSQSQDA